MEKEEETMKVENFDSLHVQLAFSYILPVYIMALHEACFIWWPGSLMYEQNILGAAVTF
jgi:hypothetical protein